MSELISIDFNYNIKHPISVYDYSQALASFNNQLNRHLKGHSYLKPKDLTLEIQKIESGSIKTKIAVSILGFTLLSISNINTLIQFIENIGKLRDYLTKQTNAKPYEFDRQDLKDIKNIIKPIVKSKESDSSLIIIAKDNSNTNIEVSIPWDEANIMKAQADEEIKKIELPSEHEHTEVLLYLEKSVRNVDKEDVGDEGIIEAISSKPVRLYFPDKNIKEAILKNPFGKSYLVNVQVLTVHGEPNVYKITHLSDSFPRH